MKKNPFTTEDDGQKVAAGSSPSEETSVPKEDAAAEPSPATIDSGAGEGTTEPSKREKFRGRVSARYPELNMDDEDAYYDQMGALMDDYEGYEKSSESIRNAMGKSPAMAEMMMAAREQDDFDPVVWMVRNNGLDLEALRDDEEYAEKLAQARQEYVADQAKGKEFLETMRNNMPATIDAQVKALEDAGFGDKAEEVIGKIFQLADDITTGKWNPEIGLLLVKGGGFDDAVSKAREEGHAEGLNTKVTDKVRKLQGKEEYIAGRQTPPAQKEPVQRKKNMFEA